MARKTPSPSTSTPLAAGATRERPAVGRATPKKRSDASAPGSLPHKRSRAEKQPSSAILRAEAMSAERVTEHRGAFLESEPYRHCCLRQLFHEDWLLEVREELLTLQRTFKETDLFKVFQTGDLANIDPANPVHAKQLAATLRLRQAIYSPAFRRFVRQITGCSELTGQTDCSCNMYARGGHLLCHDDVIGTRCISYILYLSWPGREWDAQLGGGLELYARDKLGAPEPSPCAVVPPHFGSLAFFVVTPGVSYHSVQEVFSDEPRLSISGWFHAHTPPPGADSAASLAQLERSSKANPRPFRMLPALKQSLTAEQRQRLSRWVNPSYLNEGTIRAVRAQLRSERTMQLAHFLSPTAVEKLIRAAANADKRDLPAIGRAPEYSLGLPTEDWEAVGPPQVQRYLRYSTPSPSAADGGATGGSLPTSKRKDVGFYLARVRVLLSSEPFAQLLRALSGCTPRSARVEARRFRPGLDYTLAHVGQLAGKQQVTLEATACFLPPARASKREAERLWDSGDVGGFECYVRKEEENAAAEVYRANDQSEGVTCVHAASNTLNLVLRGPDTMKFIKYVSAAAPSSRWDVAAEYKIARKT